MYKLIDQWDELLAECESIGDGTEMDAKAFVSLIRETVNAVNSVLEQGIANLSAAGIADFLDLYGYMKAYAVYPLLYEDALTFMASKILVKDLLMCIWDAVRAGQSLDLEDYYIYFCDLPDNYKQDERGRVKIPYDFATGDLSAIVGALKAGGYYDE